MDKKTLLGLLLIGAIFIGFTWYNSEKQADYMAAKAKQDSIQKVKQAAIDAENLKREAELAQRRDTIQETEQAVNPMTAEQVLEQSLGSVLYAATQGEEKFYIVENDVARYTFSNKGGRIASVELKNYQTYQKTPLKLFFPENSSFGVTLFTSRQINTDDFFFKTDLSETAPTIVENEDGTQVTPRPVRRGRKIHCHGSP